MDMHLNDIPEIPTVALLKLKETIDFEKYPHITPICLPSLKRKHNGHQNNVDSHLKQGSGTQKPWKSMYDECFVSGWGLQNVEEVSHEFITFVLIIVFKVSVLCSCILYCGLWIYNTYFYYMQMLASQIIEFWLFIQSFTCHFNIYFILRASTMTSCHQHRKKLRTQPFILPKILLQSLILIMEKVDPWRGHWASPQHWNPRSRSLFPSRS